MTLFPKIYVQIKDSAKLVMDYNAVLFNNDQTFLK